MFIQQICKGTRLLFFARSLPFPYSFLALSFLTRSLFVLCSLLMCLTANSPADSADYAEECSRAALFRRQKTVSANESAKADAANNAEKDCYHIVECCLLFIQQICKGTRLLFFARSLPFPCSFVSCSFFVRSLFVPYVFNGRSHGNKGN